MGAIRPATAEEELLLCRDSGALFAPFATRQKRLAQHWGLGWRLQHLPRLMRNPFREVLTAPPQWRLASDLPKEINGGWLRIFPKG